MKSSFIEKVGRVKFRAFKKTTERESSGSPWRYFWRRLFRHRFAVGSMVLILLLMILLVIGPVVSPYDPDRLNFKEKNQGPTLAHLMGTDELGRDQFLRILIGGRLTLTVALTTVMIAITVGVIIGAIAGYMGGIADNLLMRLTDIFFALPSLFVVIILVTIIGANFWTIVAAISLFHWMTITRLVRGSFLTLKKMEFVEASRALGMSPFHIVLRHLLPNGIGPIIVSATLGIADAILEESALSFLGLGIQPPNATWGRMLYEAEESLIHYGHWWRGFFPGFMILLVVISANFIGDGLRDAFDPTSSKKAKE